MKIELDKIRALFARIYGSIYKGIGAGDKVVKKYIRARIDEGANLFVVWGPPGSGKSTALDSIIANAENDICDKDMVLETTGLNKSINKFLLGLPRAQVRFWRHVAPRAVCIQRVLSRTSNPLCGIPGDNPEYLIKLIRKWFDTSRHALPEQ